MWRRYERYRIYFFLDFPITHGGGKNSKRPALYSFSDFAAMWCRIVVVVARLFAAHAICGGGGGRAYYTHHR